MIANYGPTIKTGYGIISGHQHSTAPFRFSLFLLVHLNNQKLSS